MESSVAPYALLVLKKQLTVGISWRDLKARSKFFGFSFFKRCHHQ